MHRINLAKTVLLASLFMLSACSIHQPSAEPTISPAAIKPTSTDVVFDYVGPVWPAPGSETNIQDYLDNLESPHEGGVGVSMNIFSVGEYLTDGVYGERLKQEVTDIDQRVDLFINNEPVPREVLIVYNTLVLEIITDQDENVLYKGPSGFDLSWNIPLFPGKHQAKFVVYGTTGKKLEYTWDFTLLE